MTGSSPISHNTFDINNYFTPDELKLLEGLHNPLPKLELNHNQLLIIAHLIKENGHNLYRIEKELKASFFPISRTSIEKIIDNSKNASIFKKIEDIQRNNSLNTKAELKAKLHAKHKSQTDAQKLQTQMIEFLHKKANTGAKWITNVAINIIVDHWKKNTENWKELKAKLAKSGVIITPNKLKELYNEFNNTDSTLPTNATTYVEELEPDSDEDSPTLTTTTTNNGEEFLAPEVEKDDFFTDFIQQQIGDSAPGLLDASEGLFQAHQALYEEPQEQYNTDKGYLEYLEELSSKSSNTDSYHQANESPGSGTSFTPSYHASMSSTTSTSTNSKPIKSGFTPETVVEIVKIFNKDGLDWPVVEDKLRHKGIYISSKRLIRYFEKKRLKLFKSFNYIPSSHGADIKLATIEKFRRIIQQNKLTIDSFVTIKSDNNGKLLDIIINLMHDFGAKWHIISDKLYTDHNVCISSYELSNIYLRLNLQIEKYIK